MHRPPLILDQPLLDPKLRTLLENLFTHDFWLWTAEMEEIYRSWSGWEALVEQWWRYIVLWSTKGTMAGKQFALRRVKFIQDQFVSASSFSFFSCLLFPAT